MEKVLKIDRKNALKKKEKRKESRIPLVVSYHQDLPPLGCIINEHWPTRQSKKRLKKVFKNKPVVSYKRPRNLICLSKQHLTMRRTFGEVSFFTGRRGLLKIGGIRYFFLDQKGGSKDFFKLKRGITYIFLKK